MRKSKYTDEELIVHAQQFKTRREWEAAGNLEVLAGNPSHHRVAFKRGVDFYRKCCVHMPDERGRHSTQKYTDQELIQSARRFTARGAWKKGANQHYQVARLRPIFDECCAHMHPAANPYASEYVVYAYTFRDLRCYVGLSFVPERRREMHLARGPVHDHLQIVSAAVFTILDSGLTCEQAIAAEAKWQAEYAARGWIALHTAKAGGLGSVRRKWTKESVLAEALKFTTKQAWIDGSQMSYRIAKREGWFDEASAHMPKRVLGIGAGRTVSEETRARQRAAKVGRTLTPEHRQKISASLRIAAAV